MKTNTFSESAQLIYQVATLYYLEGLSQVEISSKLNLSRPKVSRLLSQARENGIVTINIKMPENLEIQTLKTRIVERFNLREVQVTPCIHEDMNQRLNHAAALAAPFFQNLIKDGDTIGISWGNTLHVISKYLQPTTMSPQTSLYQIVGNLDNGDANTHSSEILKNTSDALGLIYSNSLPCPVIMESSIIVDLLLHDNKLSSLMAMVNKPDIAFPVIGVLSPESCLYKTNYIDDKYIDDLRQMKAVGNICCRFIDIDGNIVDNNLNNRTIAIQLESLKKARYSCVCIANEEKIPVLIGSIKAGYVNALSIDSKAAVSLLAYNE